MPVIKINDSSKEVLKQYVIYTGVTQVKVLAVNPTMEKLQSLGYNVSTEPVYVTEQDGIRKVRVDFYVQNNKMQGKIPFFLQDEQRMSNNKTSYEYINNYGQTTWASSLEEALNKTGKNGKKWFKEDGARVAYVGESNLINFLSQWLNTNEDDKVYIEDMDALFKGNVKELEFYVKNAASNVVWILSTYSERNDKFYQNIDNSIFVRGSFKPTAAMNKIAEYVRKKEKDGYPIKGYNGLEFKEFTIPTPKVVLPDQDTESDLSDSVDSTLF